MAKFDEREGNSCHIHLSLRDGDGAPVFAGDRQRGLSEVFEHFLAGLLAARASCCCSRRTCNPYKRFVEGSFAPTALLWGHDNRTCAFRVVGEGDSLRVETRIPGATSTRTSLSRHSSRPGFGGVDDALALPAAFDGNAHGANAPRMPTSFWRGVGTVRSQRGRSSGVLRGRG